MRLIIFHSVSDTCTDCPKYGVFPRGREACHGGLGRSDPFTAASALSLSPVSVSPSILESEKQGYLWWWGPSVLLPLCDIPGTSPSGSFCLAYKLVPVTPTLRTNTLLNGHRPGS